MRKTNRLSEVECALNEEYLRGIFPDTASTVATIPSRSLAEPVPLSLVLPNPTTALPEPQYELITHLFTSWVKRTPQQIAVCQGHRTWTYQELAESACAIAQSLLAQGYKQGD